MSLTAAVNAKMAAKRDAHLDAEAQEWIEAVTGEKFPAGVSYDDALKDGIILCKLINKLSPGAVTKVTTKGGAFALRANIELYNDACRKYGLPANELFQTVDLFEKKNISQVTLSIHALGRLAQKNGFKGPSLGPKMADENKREFTEEQLRAGEATIGLQAGYNKGANQSGQNFGNTRHM